MWSFERDCDEVVDQITEALKKAKLLVSRSFDLQSARQSFTQPQACTCPHHGTAQCACQYVILLVRYRQADPVTLVAHGSDGRTILSLDQSALIETDGEIVERIGSTIARLNPI